MNINRAGKAGVGDLQGAILVVPHRVNKRNELRLNAAFGQRKIYRRKHFRRARLNGSMRAHNSAHQRGINGRRRALPADIADHNAEPRHRIRNEVIQISANGARGNKLRGDVQVRQFRDWSAAAGVPATHGPAPDRAPGAVPAARSLRTGARSRWRSQSARPAWSWCAGVLR